MLTNEELQQIADTFGLDFQNPDQLFRVKDGVIKLGDKVWWHSDTGPEQVIAKDDDCGTLNNIKAYPDIYSIKKPYCYESFVYTDQYVE